MGSFMMAVLALALDRVFGEPEALWNRVPHPATLMGRVINTLDETLNRGEMRRIKGFVALAILVLLAAIIGYIIYWIPDFGILEMLIAAVLLAHKSLVDHVREVAQALREGLPQARNAVSLIVGRDTGSMDDSAVSRAAIESAAENFSDGVVAPIFWFLILGLPGILIYKVVNTADSMIGYENEEYAEFGYASAKLDDLLNWIPARISAALICLAHFDRGAMDVVFEDADMHRSPNAGWPEAAMAGVLGVALSGPRSYGGFMTQDEYVNPNGKMSLGADDIDRSVAALNRSWAALVAVLALPMLITLIF
ncbi:MAG: adenosylcobinamide-phosphate synthase CbiB [Pseudomonadota bacterium]